MGDLYIRNLPDDLHERLRVRAAAEETDVSELVVRIIRGELAQSSVRNWLADLASRPARHEDLDIESLMDAVR